MTVSSQSTFEPLILELFWSFWLVFPIQWNNSDSQCAVLCLILTRMAHLKSCWIWWQSRYILSYEYLLVPIVWVFKKSRMAIELYQIPCQYLWFWPDFSLQIYYYGYCVIRLIDTEHPCIITGKNPGWFFLIFVL